MTRVIYHVPTGEYRQAAKDQAHEDSLNGRDDLAVADLVGELPDEPKPWGTAVVEPGKRTVHSLVPAAEIQRRKRLDAYAVGASPTMVAEAVMELIGEGRPDALVAIHKARMGVKGEAVDLSCIAEFVQRIKATSAKTHTNAGVDNGKATTTDPDLLDAMEARRIL